MPSQSVIQITVPKVGSPDEIFLDFFYQLNHNCGHRGDAQGNRRVHQVEEKISGGARLAADLI